MTDIFYLVVGAIKVKVNKPNKPNKPNKSDKSNKSYKIYKIVERIVLLGIFLDGRTSTACSRMFKKNHKKYYLRVIFSK